MDIDRWLWYGGLKVNESEACGLTLADRCHTSPEGLICFFFLSLLSRPISLISSLISPPFFFIYLFLSSICSAIPSFSLPVPSLSVLPPSPSPLPPLLTLPSSMQTCSHACLLACLPGVLKSQKSAFLHRDDRLFITYSKRNKEKERIR